MTWARDGILILGAAVVAGAGAQRMPRVGEAAPAAEVTIHYPEDGSVFPPEFPAPTFIWRDPAGVAAWLIEVSAGGEAFRVKTRGEPPPAGEIDPRCSWEPDSLPKPPPGEGPARSWKPDARAWNAIKKLSAGRPAMVTISGIRGNDSRRILSRGRIEIRTSTDPVGAPVFYRDVPLMPSELEKGVIKPLADSALPLIAWRLLNVGETRSRVLVEGLPTCANCHSFSADGRTLAMDLDGPRNDKGIYAIARVAPLTTIRNEDVISWSSFRDQPAGRMRVGFMSQISPDGRYVVTTVGKTESELARNYYVANFKDYRFLQVFYATRGILVVYDRQTGRRQALPGADDPRFVHANAVWSPDGKYLVFGRAEAKDAYPPAGRPMAVFANDPNETQIQYDLYRIPFNDGRGGLAEPVAGASANGMSNSFPKISPDGRWIVFVQARNGLLMRPDSRLYIVPVQGGQARLMRCNTPLMNSWHSFSPNGRWLVFSSKARSPYTQMYLTHIDEDGRDSPPILIENATAANRAVNIPEFVNIPPGGLAKIEIPAVDFYGLFNRAWELAESGRYEEAVAAWRKALALSPDDAKAHNNLGVALVNAGRFDEAVAHWRKALEADNDYAEVRRNLGMALVRQGRPDEAIEQLRAALRTDSGDAAALYGLGLALMRTGRFDEAIIEFRAALKIRPGDADTHNDLAVALLRVGRLEEATGHLRRALEIAPTSAQSMFNLGNAFYMRGMVPEAVAEWRRGLRAEPDNLPVLRQVAWVLATSPESPVRDGGEAVRLAARAVRLSGGEDPAVLDTLAAAYAEAGRFPEAVETARRAISLASRQNQPPRAAAVKARLALYEAGVPFREGKPQAPSGPSRP